MAYYADSVEEHFSVKEITLMLANVLVIVAIGSPLEHSYELNTPMDVPDVPS